MAHLLPHWTWPERVGQVTPVHVYTSGDEAELFLDGRSLGRKRKGPREYRLRWDNVVYAPGLLEVRAYKNGRPWASDQQRTAGPAAALRLEADPAGRAGEGRALAFVTARVVDAQGVLVPRASPPLRFAVSGPGELVATDNGDPTSHVAFSSPERPAFNGLAVAIVRARARGRIVVTVEAEGLRPARLVIDSER
jgi:beta-galactosidase